MNVIVISALIYLSMWHIKVCLCARFMRIHSTRSYFARIKRVCGVNERCKLAARYSLVLIISFVYKVEFVQFVLFKLTTLLYTRYYVYLIMIMGDLYWYIKCKKDALSFKGSAVQHFALEFVEFVQLFISINLFKSIDWIFEKFVQVVLPHSSALEQL